MISDATVARSDIDEWRDELSALYDRLAGWLSRMDPPPIIERETATIHEERSGPYEAPKLVITSGTEGRLEVQPVARWVVGADGRVDLIGVEGPMHLILLRDRGGWYYLPDRVTMDLQPLDETLFHRLAEAFLR